MASRLPGAAGSPSTPPFFLQLHESFGLPRSRLCPRHRTLKFGNLLVPRVDDDLRPALLRLKRTQASGVSCSAPTSQTRRVDAFAPQHRSQLADLRARIG